MTDGLTAFWFLTVFSFGDPIVYSRPHTKSVLAQGMVQGLLFFASLSF
jgi:hypothetical protein